MIRNNQNRRRRGGNNNGPRPQQMGAGNNYGNRLDNRQRGNASQLLEKYRALARDAQQAGDRVTAEYYLQYADHYYRVLGDYREKTPNDGRQRGRDFYEDDSTGYAANGDEGDAGDDDDQDGDRNEARSDDDGRNQWRDDRNNGNRPRENTQREPRSDGNRSEGRDRQGWNGNGRVRDDQRPERARDDNRPERTRDDQRPERTRDETRDRPRDEPRAGDEPRPERYRNDRNERRERRPESQRPETQRLAPAEAAIIDEGPIPGLPGPATLRVRRPATNDAAPRIEAAVVVESPVTVVESDAEAPAPRRRGRPRKVVDSAPVES